MRWFATANGFRTTTALLVLLAGGCDTSPYCVGGSCGEPTGDGTGGDHGDADDGGGEFVPDGDVPEGDTPDGETPDGDVPDGEGGDVDCDGVDLMTDPANCGTCGNRCNLPNAFNACVGGVCVVERCDVNYWNVDRRDDNGCEYYCIPRMETGACDPTTCAGACDTTCNALDDDCNGTPDDCVDKQTDPNNCGACGRRCRYVNGTGECVDGVCRLAGCLPGYWNANGLDWDGCEYECGPTDGSPPPPESCNLLDDDCDGATDEENPGGGAACGETAGACEAGTLTCLAGRLECVGGTGPTAERCNNLDDDCDGITDEDPTDAGGRCGIGIGECEYGTNVCSPGGRLECLGGHDPAPEICNGRDDDCDGEYDESVTDTFDCSRPGVCVTGTPFCDAGVWVCRGEVPGGTEICNAVDDDCDTLTDEDFNLSSDLFNCGSCGNRCSLPHATAACVGGACRIAACDQDYWNLNGNHADGCEYACARVAPNYDNCNGVDDDCDGLTDGADSDFEALRPRVGAPDYFCQTLGACSGVTVQCGVVGSTTRWYCAYPPAVRTDASGTILPETLCDGVDEDCDGTTDENWPGVRHSPTDPADACTAGTGICLRTGNYECDPGDRTRQRCSVTAGTPGPTELCNGLDDNCDGTTDNFAENYFFTASTPMAVRVQGQIDSNGDGTRETSRDFYVMRWEASRPDASASSAGSINNLKPCSQNGVLPWANITQAQAEAACCRLNSDGVCHGTAGTTGSRWHLCTALDWQLACERGTSTYYTYPYGNTYTATTCNGNDYDTNPGLAGDQDDILATQTMASCRNLTAYPAGSWSYDMSGNVKEWTATSRSVSGSTYYEIRGGASNNSSLGLTCAFNFTLGSTTFQFPNVGFRCCYY